LINENNGMHRSKPMTKPPSKPEIPQPDLVKHLAAKNAKPVWILLAIAIVTLPEMLRRACWLAPSISALIASKYALSLIILKHL
jgi:hypothetical protein